MSYPPIKFKDPSIVLILHDWGNCGRPRSHTSKSLFSARFGELVKSSRIILKITQRDLSVAMNIQQASLSKLESGRREPPAFFSWRLENALGFEHGHLWFDDVAGMNKVDQARAMRLARAESGKTLTAFSESLGFSICYIRFIERGKCSVPLQYLWKVANMRTAQDMPLSWLSWAAMSASSNNTVIVPRFMNDRVFR
jgi:transcriptional regulator with XRE-family HTH domain